MNEILQDRDNSREPLFYIVVSFFVCFYLLWLIGNYDINWVHPELPKLYIPHALEEGRSIKDIFLLDWGFPTGMLRARIINHLFLALNIKLRFWLFRYIVPHPSLSSTWIFSLILSPILLFRLVYNLTFKKTTALICVLLYLVSPGFLSTVIFLFNPAKPMSNFFLIFCFYLASKISNYLKQSQRVAQKEFILLLVSLFLGFMTDEYAYFIFIYIPILWPSIFLLNGRRIKVLILYLLPLLAFFFTVTISSLITVNSTVAYWKYILSLDLVRNFSLTNMLTNSHNLLFDHIALLKLDSSYRLSFISLLGYCLYTFYAFSKLPFFEKKLFLKIFIIIVLFLGFNNFIVSIKPDLTPQNCYYYGVNFSIFWVMLVSILLSTNAKSLRIISKIIFVILLMISGYNFYVLNHLWKNGHVGIYEARFPLETKDMLTTGRLTYSLVSEAWKNRKNPKALQDLKIKFPIDSYWLFVELQYMNKNEKSHKQPI